MKLGIADRISVTDSDLADTVDVNPKYSDVVYLYQERDESIDYLADHWLGSLSEEDYR